MPLLFSYGTLQERDTQVATFGRPVPGHADALPGYERASITIDAEHAALCGRSVHANAARSANPRSRVPGTVFEVTEEDLGHCDEYERSANYERIVVRLASGNEAWVYLYGPSIRVKDERK